MQFSMILAFAAAAAAAPAMSTLEDRQAPLCSSGTPQCCATDVLNLVILNCANRTLPSTLKTFRWPRTNSPLAPTVPTNNTDFIATCAEQGQQAKCCLLPILDQALICSDVSPN